jgi:acyl-CoA hydrolase
MSSITLRFLADPSTVNIGAKVYSGSVMQWIDEACTDLSRNHQACN